MGTSATQLRRNRTTTRRQLPDGTVETTTQETPRTIGGPARRSSRESMDYSGLPGAMNSEKGGLTSQNNWDSFFNPEKLRPAPSLAPVAPIDAPGMAAAAESSDFFTNPVGFGSLGSAPLTPPPVARNPDPVAGMSFSDPNLGRRYAQAATDLSEQWFNERGVRPPPSASSPVTEPTTVLSKYGYATNSRNQGYLNRLGRLSAAKAPAWGSSFNI